MSQSSEYGASFRVLLKFTANEHSAWLKAMQPEFNTPKTIIETTAGYALLMSDQKTTQDEH